MERVPDHPILEQFTERWSPRAFDNTYKMTSDDLSVIFEAARWAPSSFNLQPWRFVYSLRGERGWSEILGSLISFNQGWAHDASALICVCSEVDVPSKGGGKAPSYSHSFDAGAAWAHLALQAHAMGLHTHGMTGFEPQVLRSAINAPDNVRVEAIIAVGRRGDPKRLPPELQSRETPSGRKPISQFVLKGAFPSLE